MIDRPVSRILDATNRIARGDFRVRIEINHTHDKYDEFDIIAENYIISTNGKKYGHPDKNILANIIINNKEKKKMIFNYEIEELKILKEQVLQSKYNYEYIISNEVII